MELAVSFERQRNKYDISGKTYETVTYGARHLQVYRNLRNEQILRSLCQYLPNAKLRILEVGCGTGLVLDSLASTGIDHVLVGLDLSRTMLRQAKQRFERGPHVPKFALASGHCLPFADQTFDVVIATRFIHLFAHEQKKLIYEEFRRLLRKGGISVVEFYARPYHWLRYYLTHASKGKSGQVYFSHYPTRAQVRDIVGEPFARRPVRLAGSRVLLRLLGERGLRCITKSVPFPTINPLVDEYLVVTRK